MSGCLPSLGCLGKEKGPRRKNKAQATPAMKKQEKGEKEKGGTTIAPAPSSTPKATKSTANTTATTPVMGMKQSKSDHSGLSRTGGKSDTAANKKYLSRSQENLSSENGKKKLSTVKEVDPGADMMPPPTTKSAPVKAGSASSMKAPPSPAIKSASASAAEKNKENQVLKEKEHNSSSAKTKAGKSGGSGSMSAMRKASSTQSIDVQSNTSGSLKSVNSNKSQTSNSIKRAQSTQNVSKDKSMKKRTSAPADVMAYNAELLANFEKEKKILEERISELTKVTEGRKGEIEKYKYEVKHLKDKLAALECNSVPEELERLCHQNKHLMDRLKELNIPVEQFTDTEKLIMKIGSGSVRSAGKSGDSVAASDFVLRGSISMDSLSAEGGAKAAAPGLTSLAHVKIDVPLQRSSSLSASEPGLSLHDFCGTPDHPSILSSMEQSCMQWDKVSNKSGNSETALSETSVQCLTERILQMEETNYSTTEELQATLQELGDLQDAVNELTEENSRLADEKAVLLESLCAQTEKLETCRTQVEQLKSLLISGNLPEKSGREDHLLDLLKSAQEEREELFRKQTEWSNALRSMEADCKDYQDTVDSLREKIQVLEESVKQSKSDRESYEQVITELRANMSADQIELKRLKSLLEAEKCKMAELEKCQQAENQSELEALLDQTRLDKTRCEQHVVNMQESLSLSQNEVIRLQEVLIAKDEELKNTSLSFKAEVADLQQRLELSLKEREEVLQEMDTLREHIDQLQQDCDTYLDEKKTYCTKVQELNADLHALRTQKSKTEMELNEVLSRHQSETEEWQQFQKDLQVAVVIANNFRAETQESMQKVSEENMALREKCLNHQLELDRIRTELQAMRSTKAFEDSRSPGRAILSNAELKGKVAGCVDRELVALRDNRRIEQRTASQSLSVKALIRSIEEQRKSGCSSIQSSHTGSRRNSTDTEVSITSYTELLKSPTTLSSPSSPSSPTKELRGLLIPMDKSTDKLSLQPRLSTTGLPTLAEAASPKATRSDGDGAGAAKGPQISSILKERGSSRRNSGIGEVDKKDPGNREALAHLARQFGGSKRNALLKWCQQRTLSYSGVDITNFSSSWNDGLAFCALLHSYLPDKISYNALDSEDKRRNFTLAFSAAESVGIYSLLEVNEMVSMERPDWQAVMTYVTSIYKHFEMDAKAGLTASSAAS